MQKIMIIEDNMKLCHELGVLLMKYGYEIVIPKDFTTILRDFKKYQPHLILLDINLPVFDGFHFCREIRKISQVPIIFLTSRDNHMDELMSITIGGDDYITKPYHADVLIARIAAILKRCYGINQLQEMIECKGLKLNIASSLVTYQNQTIELTKNELKILHTLMQNEGTIVSRERLMEILWDSDCFVDENTLTVNVNRLRKKLVEIQLDDFIVTFRGQGYKIQ